MLEQVCVDDEAEQASLSLTGLEVIKLFSCSTKLSLKFKLLIDTEIANINSSFRFKSPKPVIYPAYKC